MRVFIVVWWILADLPSGGTMTSLQLSLDANVLVFVVHVAHSISIQPLNRFGTNRVQNNPSSVCVSHLEVHWDSMNPSAEEEEFIVFILALWPCARLLTCSIETNRINYWAVSPSAGWFLPLKTQESNHQPSSLSLTHSGRLLVGRSSAFTSLHESADYCFYSLLFVFFINNNAIRLNYR